MSGYEKKIPESLKECYAADGVSSKLWKLSDRLEVWGGRLIIIIIILGILVTIGEVIQITETYGEVTPFSEIVGAALAWIMYAVMVYFSFHLSSMVFSALAAIVQNTKTTADIAIYNTARTEGKIIGTATSPTSPPPSAQNQKSGYSLSQIANEQDNINGYWVCNNCRVKNDSSSLYCKDCGAYK